MRGLIVSSAAAAAALLAAPLSAQKVGNDVAGYLCTFAGKCDSNASAAVDGETPVKAAPATKGFRLAAAQQAQQPTVAAPATKGFRLSAPAQSTAPAPATKGFRLSNATPAPAATSTRPARVTRAAAKRVRTPRASYAAARPAPIAGARADLMLSFGYNSDQMTPAAEAKARGFAQALMMPELAGKRFMIEGHTDSRGSRDFNVDLSRRRAQSVADYLVAQGVDRSRVEVRGVGPDEPLPGRSAGAEANRRVEAVLIG